jgi:hypothetical protein
LSTWPNSPKNITTHHLRQFREELLARLDAVNQNVTTRMDALDQKVNAVAGTLVSVQRDINAAQRDLTSLNNRIGVLVVHKNATGADREEA